MSQSDPISIASPSTPLSRALEQNEGAQEVVESSAEELAVINAVLQQELPDPVQVGDIAEALKKADSMEDRMHDAAQDLAEVNHALEQEIDARLDLERELRAAKAALAKANANARAR